MRESAPAAFPGHDGGAWSPVPAAVVASWPAGHFAENLAVDAAGAVFVSLHSHNTVMRYDPDGGALAVFTTLPAPVAGLAFDAAGALWATGGVLGQAPGIVWRIAPDGEAVEWARIADAVFLNGSTPHPDGHRLLVCESMTGRIIAVDQRRQGVWHNWFADQRLCPSSQQTPGANGIKFWRDEAWISVTDLNLMYRIGLGADGNPGALQIAAEHVRADDFAFGASGALYIATHPAQTVMRIGPTADRATIAGPVEGAVGSTACAFGRAKSDQTALYVTTTGGLWSPYRGAVQDAKLLRLDVGEPGLPLLPV
jgi:sugar lactone lactonase YvrE